MGKDLLELSWAEVGTAESVGWWMHKGDTPSKGNIHGLAIDREHVGGVNFFISQYFKPKSHN